MMHPNCQYSPRGAPEPHILGTQSIRDCYVNTAVVIMLGNNSLKSPQRTSLSIIPVTPMPSQEKGRGGQGLLTMIATVFY